MVDTRKIQGGALVPVWIGGTGDDITLGGETTPQVASQSQDDSKSFVANVWQTVRGWIGRREN